MWVCNYISEYGKPKIVQGMALPEPEMRTSVLEGGTTVSYYFDISVAYMLLQ